METDTWICIAWEYEGGKPKVLITHMTKVAMMFISDMNTSNITVFSMDKDGVVNCEVGQNLLVGASNE